MDKYLVFTFRDGSLYKVPLQVVARHYCKQHQTETFEDSDLLKHWPLMPFSEIKDDLTKISSMPGLKASQFLADATAEIMTTLQLEEKLFTQNAKS